jgi:Trypsin-co-occurring domain 2
MAEKPGIELAALIRTLREELAEAVAEGEGKGVRFALEDVELELQVTVGRSVEGKAGIKIWLVEAGGGGEASRETVQKIKLTLKPGPPWSGRLAAKRPADLE